MINWIEHISTDALRKSDQIHASLMWFGAWPLGNHQRYDEITNVCLPGKMPNLNNLLFGGGLQDSSTL